MGHRALVAYERPDGRYSVHYSHWGGYRAELAAQITPETPFGSENMEPDYLTALLQALDAATDDAEITGVVTEAQPDTPVRPRPSGVANSLADFAEKYVDYLMHECVYVVDADFTVTAYDTPQLHTAGPETIGMGALVECTPETWGDATGRAYEWRIEKAGFDPADNPERRLWADTYLTPEEFEEHVRREFGSRVAPFSPLAGRPTADA
jgi:hypothetical protein